MMKINNVNDNKQNKIILKASAGTGKTYRLSLEYIANLADLRLSVSDCIWKIWLDRFGKQPKRTL